VTRQTKSNSPRLNRLNFMAFYQDFTGRITSAVAKGGTEHSPVMPEMESRERHFGESTNITDMFQDYMNLLQFVACSGHRPPTKVCTLKFFFLFCSPVLRSSGFKYLHTVQQRHPSVLRILLIILHSIRSASSAGNLQPINKVFMTHSSE